MQFRQRSWDSASMMTSKALRPACRTAPQAHQPSPLHILRPAVTALPWTHQALPHLQGLAWSSLLLPLPGLANAPSAALSGRFPRAPIERHPCVLGPARCWVPGRSPTYVLPAQRPDTKLGKTPHTGGQSTAGTCRKASGAISHFAPLTLYRRLHS